MSDITRRQASAGTAYQEGYKAGERQGKLSAATEIERLRAEISQLAIHRGQVIGRADEVLQAEIERLRARNAELAAALQDAIKMIEVVCAPIATAHLRATLVKAEEQ